MVTLNMQEWAKVALQLQVHETINKPIVIIITCMFFSPYEQL